ncbi:MAG: 6-phosphofructokinase [Chitinophagaceae bacterium]|nr:6-phosphofructokinase [Chitinophagaceae bacterium]
MKHIGILSSGGDSPGMNAAIRAAARTALYHGLVPYGIQRGYQGLMEGDLRPMGSRDVSNIIQRGGTILKSARSEAFRTVEGRRTAYEQVKAHQLDALVLIGGDGTIRGAEAFYQEYQIPAIALPGTIDNDLNGTDFTIGFDTAINTAVDAIDKIRDTASSHNRIFLVEVMGRDAGYIALYSGLACGAEHIFIPENQEALDKVIQTIQDDRQRKKESNIIVIAEGDEFGGADALRQQLAKVIPENTMRVVILGHIQRGGSPSCMDRILASRLGQAAVEGLIQGNVQCMAGLINGEIQYTPFQDCVKKLKPMPSDMLRMIDQLR